MLIVCIYICEVEEKKIKIFVRLWWLNGIEIKYISDKKIIKFLQKKLNGPVQKNKIKWKKKENWNIILKNVEKVASVSWREVLVK
jgi:hypothetical protein